MGKGKNYESTWGTAIWCVSFDLNEESIQID
jgi:hypothetical protein